MKKTLTLILLLAAALAAAAGPSGARGVMNIGAEHAADIQPTQLNGEWEFYWNHLLTPADIAAGTVPPMHAHVPSSWTSYDLGSHKLPAHGYGTYRLLLTVPATASTVTYGLKMRSVYSSYTLWINGEQALKVGEVTQGTQGARPEFRNEIVPVTLRPSGNATVDTIEIVAQVSNYSHRRGGLYDPLEIGPYSEMLRSTHVTDIINLILAGLLVLIFLKHVCLFYWDRTQKADLYLSFTCLVIMFRSLASIDRFVTLIFPSIGWETVFKLDSLSAYCSVTMIALIFKTLMPKHAPRWPMRFILCAGLLIAATVLFTSVDIHSRFQTACELYVGAAGLYMLVCVVLRAALQKEPYAMYSLVGLGLLFGMAMVDLVANHTNLAPVGMVIFAVMQSLATDNRSMDAVAANTKLNDAIQAERDQLEAKVEERASELQQHNQQLAEHQRKEEAQNRVNTGVARINEVVSHHDGDYKQLCYKILVQALKHIGAQVGAVYVADRSADPPALEMVASFGLARADRRGRERIPTGEGMEGETFQFRTTHLLTRVPAGLLTIGSGTGRATPRALYIAPLATEKETLGVIEIASLGAIGELEKEFLDKAAAIVTSHIDTTLANERNERLIRDFEARAQRIRDNQERLSECLSDLQEAREERDQLRDQLAAARDRGR